ncbi:MAG: hypothetical protein J7M38_01040 [Armatimonadetes bacterium]|nr:hypothetical protein [Armatimonadota bacterium]
MRIRHNITLITIAACLLAARVVADEPATVVIADFETGVGAWLTNDGHVNGAGPSELCGIYAIARTEQGRTEQAAMIEFKAARGTWASVRLPVSGITWLQHNVGQISMWLRGDGTDHTVDLTLRALVGEEKRDVSYVYKLSLENPEWEHRAIRLFAFKNRDGQPIDAEALRGVYLIQFVQTGSWPAMTFCVDDLYGEPVPGINMGGPATPEALVARVDFRQVMGPILGQIGANLGPNPWPVLDHRASSDRARAALRQLTPCLVRVRLSDYFRPVKNDYDLIRLNRAINWIADAGATPLVCLDPGAPPPGGDADEHYRQFLATAVKIVSLRRGGPRLRRYELFDAPMLSGRFADLGELVAAYDDLARRVLAADPEARVGGPGFASAWANNIRGFLEHAATMHFLSLKFFGAQAATAKPAALFAAAVTGTGSDLPEQLSIVETAELVRARRPMPELFVSAMAPSAAADARPDQAFAAAWLAAMALSAGPYADRLLHQSLVGALLGADGAPLPAQRAAALVTAAAPRGATLCQLALPDPQLLVAAIWTPKARNLVVVHAGETPRTVVADCRGVGSPLRVRGSLLASDGKIHNSDRPDSPRQSIEFDGPGVAVIEFVTDM